MTAWTWQVDNSNPHPPVEAHAGRPDLPDRDRPITMGGPGGADIYKTREARA